MRRCGATTTSRSASHIRIDGHFRTFPDICGPTRLPWPFEATLAHAALPDRTNPLPDGRGRLNSPHVWGFLPGPLRRSTGAEPRAGQV